LQVLQPDCEIENKSTAIPRKVTCYNGALDNTYQQGDRSGFKTNRFHQPFWDLWVLSAKVSGNRSVTKFSATPRRFCDGL